MSMPEITLVVAPREPMYVKCRNTLCQIFSMFFGSSPSSKIRHMPDQRCNPSIGLLPSTGNLAPSRHALVGIHFYK